uniref:Uncharacterized protein n=1 Tax=Medicago truncatula TaxID=3880 RepID=I3SPK3_MEDTR|nr:unknown [Medicago truncatula]
MATIADRQHFPNHSNFTVNINGTNITVTVTASASVVQEWINTTVSIGADLLRRYRLEVALSMDPAANTLHLCVGVRCLIFQLSRADCIPPNLRSFVYSSHCRFGGFWNRGHRQLLLSKYGLVMNYDPMDLRLLKGGLENLTTEGIIYECHGFRVDLKEEIRTSDWNQEKLSDDQVLYACLESYCALNCGVKLNLWLLGF